LFNYLYRASCYCWFWPTSTTQDLKHLFCHIGSQAIIHTSCYAKQALGWCWCGRHT
jgi:hypothetical protein